MLASIGPIWSKSKEGIKNLDFSVQSADNLASFKSKSFDAVTMSYVLMFVPDKEKSLREIGRVLRAGGHAFIAIWKKMPFFALSLEAYAEIAGEQPKEIPVNPIALAKDHAMQDLIESTRGLLVLEQEEPVSYSFPMGTAKDTCDSSMVVAGAWLETLKAKGMTDAVERFCSTFIRKLEENGMKTGSTYEITGAEALLLSLKKPEMFADELWCRVFVAHFCSNLSWDIKKGETSCSCSYRSFFSGDYFRLTNPPNRLKAKSVRLCKTKNWYHKISQYNFPSEGSAPTIWKPIYWWGAGTAGGSSQAAELAPGKADLSSYCWSLQKK